MLQFFGQSLLYGNQYIYESMPRMLSLWLDYGAEVAEGEGKGKNEQVMKGMKSLLSQLNKVSTYWDWKVSLLVVSALVISGYPLHRENRKNGQQISLSGKTQGI